MRKRARREPPRREQPAGHRRLRPRLLHHHWCARAERPDLFLTPPLSRTRRPHHAFLTLRASCKRPLLLASGVSLFLQLVLQASKSTNSLDRCSRRRQVLPVLGVHPTVRCGAFPAPACSILKWHVPAAQPRTGSRARASQSCRATRARKRSRGWTRCATRPARRAWRTSGATCRRQCRPTRPSSARRRARSPVWLPCTAAQV